MRYPAKRAEPFSAAVSANPANMAPQLIMRDWLLEQSVDDAIADEAVLRRPLWFWDIWSFGIGIGSGSGIGSGIGRGSGIGSGIGRGIGSGSGIGSGIGIGSGRGSGSGIGRGIGSGSGSGSGSDPYKVKIMRIGQAYMIHCGDWHTFVGRVVEQIGPATYVLESVSKIAETNNGDCWDALAAGDKLLRNACTYRHYKTKAVIPLVIAAFEWEGKLPQEK